MLHFDAIIIGAGVSGMTASIYLKRAGIKTLLLEKSMPGGQLNKISSIENYPGFKSIDGPTLAINILEQIKNLQIDYKIENVISIDKDSNEFIIKTNKETYKTRAILLTTGRKPKYLGLENERKLIGKGISLCATCDGYFFKEKEVVVVGGGNSALEEALYLSKICKKVYIIHRKSEFRADNILKNEVKEKNNIIIKYSCEITNIIETNDKLSGLIIKGENIEEKLDIEGLFISIGSDPDTDVFVDLGIDLENKHIVVNNKMETNIKGVFAGGDAIKKDIYQISTAVGEGTVAAISAINYLKTN